MIPETLPQNTHKPVSAMAFDYGTQRIGVAYGQSLSGTAQPVTVIKARDGIPNWEELESLIGEWAPDVFIVGLPYNLDGSDSELLERAIKFGNRLNGRYHKPFYGMDERLSSKEATEKIYAEDSPHKNTTSIDHIAAQIILENWFAEYNKK